MVQIKQTAALPLMGVVTLIFYYQRKADQRPPYLSVEAAITGHGKTEAS